MGARALLLDINLIWFGYIARLSQWEWGGRGVSTLLMQVTQRSVTMPSYINTFYLMMEHIQYVGHTG